MGIPKILEMAGGLETRKNPNRKCQDPGIPKSVISGQNPYLGPLTFDLGSRKVSFPGIPESVISWGSGEINGETPEGFFGIPEMTLSDTFRDPRHFCRTHVNSPILFDILTAGIPEMTLLTTF